MLTLETNPGTVVVARGREFEVDGLVDGMLALHRRADLTTLRLGGGLVLFGENIALAPKPYDGRLGTLLEAAAQALEELPDGFMHAVSRLFTVGGVHFAIESGHVIPERGEIRLVYKLYLQTSKRFPYLVEQSARDWPEITLRPSEEDVLGQWKAQARDARTGFVAAVESIAKILHDPDAGRHFGRDASGPGSDRDFNGA